MNGDEDLGQDITMKGQKFHYNQGAWVLGGQSSQLLNEKTINW